VNCYRIKLSKGTSEFPQELIERTVLPRKRHRSIERPALRGRHYQQLADGLNIELTRTVAPAMIRDELLNR
jgi:hypothetical protein